MEGCFVALHQVERIKVFTFSQNWNGEQNPFNKKVMNEYETSRVEITFNLHLILGATKVIFTCFLLLTPGSVDFPEKYIFFIIN